MRNPNCTLCDPQLIETAPKDRRILLYVPGDGAWADAWWFGQWDCRHHEWVLGVPTTIADRQLHLRGYKTPTHWLPSPESPR